MDNDKKNRTTKEVIYKPHVIVDYNKTISGVDLLNQVLIPYYTQRWRIKWYRKIGEFMLGISVYNSFIVYRKLSPQNGIKDHLRYCMELIEEILTHHLLGVVSYQHSTTPPTYFFSLRDILFLKSPGHLVNPLPKENVFTAQSLEQGEIFVFGTEDVGSVCAYQSVLKFTTQKKLCQGVDADGGEND